MKQKSKIKNQKSKINAGFTLVELLASIIVLVAVGAIIAGIITSSFRGTNKTNVNENIRQNGNYTLSQIAKSIGYAQTFNGLSNDGVSYVTSCPFSAADPPVPVITSFNFIKVTPFDESPIVYNCNSSTLTANGASLIETESLLLNNCTMKCTQTRSTDVPIIGISFTLESAKRTGGLVEESTPPVQFETSFTIRNYKR